MQDYPDSKLEIIDIAPGLWIWRTTHCHWGPNQGWDPLVTSTCVEGNGERLVVDPIAPCGTLGAIGENKPPVSNSNELWQRFYKNPPTCVAVINPDHVRDLDYFVRRYDAKAFGPKLFFRWHIPEVDLFTIIPGTELPCGSIALFDSRAPHETPLWLPFHKTLVFADTLTAPRGELQVWWSPWHEERALPSLKAMLELPFERVIVSHGEPIHTRDEFINALSRPTWAG